MEKIDIVSQIEEMNKKYGFDKVPLTEKILSFKMMCLMEELKETYTAAFIDKNPEETVDGLVDICIFSIGILYNAGIDVRKAFDEVNKANMTKIRGTKKERGNSDGIDLTKPEGWKAPSHKGNTGQIGTLFS